MRAGKDSARMTPEQYLRFLQQFKFSQESLQARPGPRGEPFRL
jgi:hypothetical protein